MDWSYYERRMGQLGERTGRGRDSDGVLQPKRETLVKQVAK